MIPRIQWPPKSRDELASPFIRGKGERPLRLTFDTSSFHNVPEREATAIELMKALSTRTELDLVATEPGQIPYLEIEPADDKSDIIPINVLRDSRRIRGSFIPQANIWPKAASDLEKNDPAKRNAGMILPKLLLAQAHRRIGSDILVTLSGALIDHRYDNWLKEVNIYTPTEAVKIVGLFLRSRGAYMAADHMEPFRLLELGPGPFYQWLANIRLPKVANYIRQCSRIEDEDVEGLGQSIHDRCARSLQVRDMIGYQFYAATGDDPTTSLSWQMHPDNDPEMEVMPYFEYLTFVLSGVLDAQSRVTGRIFGLKEGDSRAGFHQERFRQALKRQASLLSYETPLLNLIGEKWFKDINTLLREPRNTIHTIGMRAFSAGPISLPGSFAQPEHNFVDIPERLKVLLLQATESFGSAERWGFVSVRHNIWLEPYAYASALVDECFKAFEAVAERTNFQVRFSHIPREEAASDSPPGYQSIRDALRMTVDLLG